MKKRKISWLTWSLCDKNESSALLNPGATIYGNWNEDELSKALVNILKIKLIITSLKV